MSRKSSYNDEEKQQIQLLIKSLPYNFRYDNISLHRKAPFDINEKLLWKDFTLCFKWGFENILGEFYLGKLSNILRELLHIDHVTDVRSSVKRTFVEWIAKYNP